MFKGRFAYQFERARDYCEELRSSNPGTTTKITLHTPTLHFKRMYVCLAACRTGFMNECRPIISLDACHLRGFAVCEVENKDSWSWFLELLLADIGPVREHG